MTSVPRAPLLSIDVVEPPPPVKWQFARLRSRHHGYQRLPPLSDSGKQIPETPDQYNEDTEAVVFNKSGAQVLPADAEEAAALTPQRRSMHLVKQLYGRQRRLQTAEDRRIRCQRWFSQMLGAGFTGTDYETRCAILLSAQKPAEPKDRKGVILHLAHAAIHDADCGVHGAFLRDWLINGSEPNDLDLLAVDVTTSAAKIAAAVYKYGIHVTAERKNAGAHALVFKVKSGGLKGVTVVVGMRCYHDYVGSAASESDISDLLFTKSGLCQKPERRVRSKASPHTASQTSFEHILPSAEVEEYADWDDVCSVEELWPDEDAEVAAELVASMLDTDVPEKESHKLMRLLYAELAESLKSPSARRLDSKTLTRELYAEVAASSMFPGISRSESEAVVRALHAEAAACLKSPGASRVEPQAVARAIYAEAAASMMSPGVSDSEPQALSPRAPAECLEEDRGRQLPLGGQLSAASARFAAAAFSGASAAKRESAHNSGNSGQTAMPKAYPQAPPPPPQAAPAPPMPTLDDLLYCSPRISLGENRAGLAKAAPRQLGKRLPQLKSSSRGPYSAR